MERIVQVVGCLEPGGLENLIMNIYRNIDREKYQFDFVVHRKIVGTFDEEVLKLGGKIYHAPRYVLLNHLSYKRWWNIFLKHILNTNLSMLIFVQLLSLFSKRLKNTE